MYDYIATINRNGYVFDVRYSMHYRQATPSHVRELATKQFNGSKVVRIRKAK